MVNEQLYRNVNRTLWTGIALVGALTLGKVAIQYASLPFSRRVPESEVRQFVGNIAREHDFKEPIRLEFIDNWTGYGAACADYDSTTGENIIRLTKPYLRESVLRHETKHVVKGHVKHNKRNIFQREYNEWVATLYSIGITN